MFDDFKPSKDLNLSQCYEILVQCASILGLSHNIFITGDDKNQRACIDKRATEWIQSDDYFNYKAFIIIFHFKNSARGVILLRPEYFEHILKAEYCMSNVEEILIRESIDE